MNGGQIAYLKAIDPQNIRAVDVAFQGNQLTTRPLNHSEPAFWYSLGYEPLFRFLLFERLLPIMFA